MIGMGPAGELRYPSYPLSRWKFCGIGEFQVYDKHALESLRSAALAVGRPDWASPPPPAHVGNYNSRATDTFFFTTGFAADFGRFFMDWYFSALKRHGARILGIARRALGDRAKISGKISGIHWWYNYRSHAAEATAGYYNTNARDGYAELAEIFAKEDALLDFTCLEMKNTDNPEDCYSRPETLVMQVVDAAKTQGARFSGENALERRDEKAFMQMMRYANYAEAFTYLRLAPDLVEPDNLRNLGAFAAAAK